MVQAAPTAGQDVARHPSEPDRFVVWLYERALGRPHFTPVGIAAELGVPLPRVRRALDELRELRLVKPAEDGGSLLVAVSPDTAQVELLVPLERAIHDQRRRLAGFKGQLRSFAAAFDKQAKARTESVVVTDDPQELRLRLLDAAQRCTGELLVMQPCVAQETAELRLARPLVLEALQRGVRARVLYPHTARGDAGTRAHIGALMAVGGQARTTKEVHDRFLVFDRQVAFIPAGEGDAVAVVYDGAVAAFLGGLHERYWASAFEFDSAAGGYAGTIEEVKATILELLASGAKDDVIARRVAMSDRTFRRHLAAIMQDLSATSRFQAGVLAARTGLVGPAPRNAA